MTGLERTFLTQLSYFTNLHVKWCNFDHSFKVALILAADGERAAWHLDLVSFLFGSLSTHAPRPRRLGP